MVSHMSLNFELGLSPECIGNKDGESSLPTSSNHCDAPQIPVPKQTRRWAGWTRQEEELFFGALRQVGKNFEKITRRVQSKDKDQVRHYYYRLVRRMNKLLGPEFALDARNSKETIAAMLRWWSLLEKYSCKASKLHLKPRRFKIFIETLENQLLKDRKKNIKKRVSTGVENSSVGQIPTASQGRSSGIDNRAVKMVLVGSENTQKIGTRKGSLLKQNVKGATRTNLKPNSASAKTEKRRGKAGLVSASAYKRWEKAAIAGVSLVADAAEHLERVDTDIEHLQDTERPDHDGSLHITKDVLNSQPMPSLDIPKENPLQNLSKLKLQLFPIDVCTQKALEKDQHNPHLELTLSTRKKISSVVEHLNRKWGNSSLSSQEFMLLPFWAQRENLPGYQKWTKDSPLCAADVFYLIGSPPVFRLRYGWFSKADMEGETQALGGTNHTFRNLNIREPEDEGLTTLRKDQRASAEHMTTVTSSSTCTPVRTTEYGGSLSNKNSEKHIDSNSGTSLLRKQDGALAVNRQKDTASSAVEWSGNLTTSVSMGDLLSDSTQMDVSSSEFPVPVGSNFFQQSSFTCDSFDAAIAAHIYKHQNRDDLQQGIGSHVPSIWDAEETCDAFAFQKSRMFCDEVQSSSRNVSLQAPRESILGSSSVIQRDIEVSSEMRKSNDVGPSREDLMGDSTKDFGLTEISWPDSLGPLDLDIGPRRYHNDDQILSDSLGGINRLIANSMDSFQSCSFLRLDKKEITPTPEARETLSFANFKISSEV